MKRQGGCPNLAVCPKLPSFTLFGCTGEKGELNACTKCSVIKADFFFKWSPRIKKSTSVNG